MAGSPWTNQSVNLILLTEQTTGFSGLFGYSPAPGSGNLIFSLAAAPGVDPYGNSYQQGIYTSVGNIQANSYISETAGGGVFIYGMGSTGASSVFTSSSTWTCPAGFSLAKVECWGAGGAGSGAPADGSGGGGGGGEYAAEPAETVIAGDSYTITVGDAGVGGAGSGGSGGLSSFSGHSAVVVTANGGTGGTTAGTAGTGGTGSTNSVHFNGGAGAAASGSGGGGGGGSGGRSQQGNAGGVPTGAAAVAGGGPGGDGAALNNGPGSAPVSGPGGGGGAGSTLFDQVAPGGSGAAGQVVVTPYTNTGLSLVAALAGSSTTDPLTGTAVPQGLLTQLAYLLPQGQTPATPAADCVLYYKGGSLFALGPSGNPITLATT